MTGALAVIDAVVTPAAFCAVLAGALGYAWRIYRQRYLLLWALFWTLFALVWGFAGWAWQLEPGSPMQPILRAAMITSSLGARAALACSVFAYLGWRPLSSRQRVLLVLALLLVVAAQLGAVRLAGDGRIAAWAVLPFRTYFLGVFLNSWLALLLLRRWREARSSRLFGAAVAFNAFSDALDVYLDMAGRRPWTGAGPAHWLSMFTAHLCEMLFATGMMVAAIGTEYARAEAAAAALRERDAHLHESQRREMLGRLAGGLAHDFNNLLAAVLAHLSFARDALPAGSEVRTDVETAATAAERGARLTRQLLTFARRQPLAPKPLDLNALIAGLDRLVAPLLGKNIQRQVRLGDGLWLVRADAMQLEQLILNLLLNARDAMPEGGTVRVETCNQMVAHDGAADAEAAGVAPGAWVRLEVEDGGHGMDETTRARAFEPFFTTKQSGTGLGLATVQTIVQQAGGRVALRTAPGAGARFTIWLPRSLEPVAAPAASLDQAAGGRETILFVEDDAPLRELGVRALEGRGYRVLAMPGGAEALALAEETLARVALLVTDVMMPGLDGPALAAALRQRRPRLKVLYVSGYAPKLPLEENRDAPFLSKPFTPEQLLALVRQLLDAPARPAEARAPSA